MHGRGVGGTLGQAQGVGGTLRGMRGTLGQAQGDCTSGLELSMTAGSCSPPAACSPGFPGSQHLQCFHLFSERI